MYKLILPAREIADHTKVTKPTGKAVYTLRTHITLFSRSPRTRVADREVSSGDNIRYLVTPSTGDVNVIADSLPLALIFETLEDLHDWSRDKIEEEE